VFGFFLFLFIYPFSLPAYRTLAWQHGVTRRRVRRRTPSYVYFESTGTRMRARGKFKNGLCVFREYRDRDGKVRGNFKFCRWNLLFEHCTFLQASKGGYHDDHHANKKTRWAAGRPPSFGPFEPTKIGPPHSIPWQD
jgi:hypothetical protein